MSAHPLSEGLLVKALRAQESDLVSVGRHVQARLCVQAADALDAAAAANAEHERFVADVLHIRGEIEWLGVENERLRKALERAACKMEECAEGQRDTETFDFLMKWATEARAALAPKETKDAH